MRRLTLIGTILVVLYACILFRLIYLQFIRADDFRKEAASQHYIEFTLPATRGEIQASDGSVLVTNQPAYLVYAQIKDVKDIRRTAEGLAPILHREPADIEGDLSIPGRVWIPLAHKVPEDSANAIRSLGMPGIGFEKESVRFYPEASMAAHLLGFVGSDADGNDKGYFGIEGYYDRALRGKDGYLRQEKDVHGAPIVIGDITRFDAQDGQNLTLWLDKSVQKIIEEELARGISAYGAKDGSVTVMDPATGGILGMAALPSYDPAHYQDYQHDEFKNPMVASSYEPGSTFKVLVMAAGVNEKAVTALTQMNEDGPTRIGEYLIRTWNDKYLGTVTMTDVLIHSSNVGMVFVGRKLGSSKLLSYINRFGFGLPTGIDLEEETSPDLRPEKDWKEIDYATATFGQGIAVTPLQMVRAVSAIANGGFLVEPHVVKNISDDTGRTVSIKPKILKQVISGSTASVLTEMMIASVDKGEAKFAKPAGYRIAGKTGTAQVPIAGHYDPKITIASFIGFAPADHPLFIMLVTLRQPTTSPWGSETAAPLFFAIAKRLFNYYGIPPDR